MLLDVHFAFLVAALAVMGGLTFTIGQFLDYKIEQARENRKAKNDLLDSEGEVFQP